MSLEEYLQQNIKPEILKKATEFKTSPAYEAIQTYTTSGRYKQAKVQLKLRDSSIHKSTLADIKRLQEFAVQF